LARAAGLPLRIAAKIPRGESRYFRERIEPLIDGRDIEFVGEVDDAKKEEFLGKAAALVFPIDWPEPFGLVMIEAMACGTPVIATRRGSVPEVLSNAVSGFVVESEERRSQPFTASQRSTVEAYERNSNGASTLDEWLKTICSFTRNWRRGVEASPGAAGGNEKQFQDRLRNSSRSTAKLTGTATQTERLIYRSGWATPQPCHAPVGSWVHPSAGRRTAIESDAWPRIILPGSNGFSSRRFTRASSGVGLNSAHLSLITTAAISRTGWRRSGPESLWGKGISW